MMNKPKMKALLLFVLCLALLSACSSNSEPAPEENTNESNQSEETMQNNASSEPFDLRFMAAAQSGSWYPLAVTFTEGLKKNMSNLEQISIEPGGGVSNIIAVNNGQAQMGFSQAMPTVDGLAGNPPFDSKNDNVEYVLSLFPHSSHVVVLKDSGITKIEDVKGKNINVGPKGLLTEDIAKRTLETYGMSYDDMASVQNLSFADSVEQMKDGHLDVLFWTVPEPFAVLTDLAESKDMVLLPLPEDKIEALASQNPGLIKSTLKAGTYNGVDYDVPTVQSPLVVIASKDASEDLVYQMTKTIYEGIDEWKKTNNLLIPVDKDDIAVDIGAPMHPGAKRFFEEVGLLK